MENIEKGYTSSNIFILSNNNAGIKALHNYQINFALVCDCHHSLVELVECNRIQLVLVLGHMGIDGS
jgi:predicted TIM-barrel fold metal-dependent hydrolase